jgi:hypothetical protein
MSTLLEQSIVDADALKSVALKNAEEIVINKYSGQIKEAVEALLEQEPAPIEDLMVDEEAPASAEDLDVLVADMELASKDGLDNCVSEDEPVIININDLMQSFDQNPHEVPSETHEDLAAELVAESNNLEEEIDLEGLDLEDLVEKLTVDIAQEKSGWAGTAESELLEAEKIALAKAQDEDYQEELKDMLAAVKKLENLNEGLQNKLAEKEEQNQDMRQKVNNIFKAATLIKEKLDETNMSNARLLYTNKVLLSTSLNERQKNKIVEAIAKSSTIEEAKMIFETLQSATGSTLNKKRPQSLSEAVNKTTSTVLLSRRDETKERKDPGLDRWKLLAGIKNN